MMRASARLLLDAALPAGLRAGTLRPAEADAGHAGKSLSVGSPVNIRHGKAAGETSVVIRQRGGKRLFYDLTVRRNPGKIDALRQETFVTGTVKGLASTGRAPDIASHLGKVVNLLHVTVPPGGVPVKYSLARWRNLAEAPGPRHKNHFFGRPVRNHNPAPAPAWGTVTGRRRIRSPWRRTAAQPGKMGDLHCFR